MSGMEESAEHHHFWVQAPVPALDVDGGEPPPLREAGMRRGRSPEGVRRMEHKSLERLAEFREVAALSEVF